MAFLLLSQLKLTQCHFHCYQNISIIGIKGGLYGKVLARKSVNYDTLRYVIVELTHPEVEIPPRTFLTTYLYNISLIGIKGGLYGKASARQSANYGALRYVIVELNHPEAEMPPWIFLQSTPPVCGVGTYSCPNMS